MRLPFLRRRVRGVSSAICTGEIFSLFGSHMRTKLLPSGKTEAEIKVRNPPGKAGYFGALQFAYANF